MELRLNLLEELKKEFNIPKEYEAFELRNSVEEILSKHGESTIYSKVFKIMNQNKPTETLGIYDCDQIITGEDFVYVDVKLYHSCETSQLVYLFCKDVNEIYKKYLEGKTEYIPELPISAGIYKPGKTMMGWCLTPIPMGNVLRPILNDDLYSTLRDEITNFLKMENVYEELGVDYKRGVMLYGAPGNGKTTFIKSLMKEQNNAVCVLVNSGGGLIDFLEYFMALENSQDLLKIVVLEDIDGMSHNVRSQLLNFLDGVQEIHKTIFIATTNYPDKVDEALKERPSRFDSIYKIDKPNEDTRRKLLQMYFKNIDEVQLTACVKESEGFSGAFFKEFYLFSRLNNFDALKAIQVIKERRKECK